MKNIRDSLVIVFVLVATFMAAMMLTGCTSLPNYGDDLPLRIEVENNNWNVTSVYAYCDGRRVYTLSPIAKGQTYRRQFRPRGTCQSLYLKAHLLGQRVNGARMETQVTDAVNLGPGQTLTVVIEERLTLTKWYVR